MAAKSAAVHGSSLLKLASSTIQSRPHAASFATASALDFANESACKTYVKEAGEDCAKMELPMARNCTRKTGNNDSFISKISGWKNAGAKVQPASASIRLSEKTSPPRRKKRVICSRSWR